jgi:hypothetical protein
VELVPRLPTNSTKKVESFVYEKKSLYPFGSELEQIKAIEIDSNNDWFGWHIRTVS